ncbi:MAG TPA: glycosyltransferase family 9 protein [Chthoniobacterales bacterium]|nr:glycosyltransferase family 9 protein [Chthoniobacterales bacterium]
MNRILVIRGGAIGDFILTLPAIKLLRDRFPGAHVEILGHTHITALAEKRFYADVVRSIESGPLASFFAKDSALPEEWVEYFHSFDLIVSYLFDPDGIFETNLKRCRIKTIVVGPSKLAGGEHAALQLARPLEQVGLHLEAQAAAIYPAEEDREFARNFLGDAAKPIIALHPGSGSETKNWPIENWTELGEHLFSTGRMILVVAGEADEERARLLESAWKGKPARFAKHLPLPRLAGLLESALFLGHDSGISHLAAAAGARCILLFGRTDPAIWAPMNESVTVLRAPEGDLRLLAVDHVIAALRPLMSLRP